MPVPSIVKAEKSDVIKNIDNRCWLFLLKQLHAVLASVLKQYSCHKTSGFVTVFIYCE